MKIPSSNSKTVLNVRNNFCTQHVLPMFCKKKSFSQRFTCTVAFKTIKARCVRKFVKWPVAVYRIQIVPDSAFEALFYVKEGFILPAYITNWGVPNWICFIFNRLFFVCNGELFRFHSKNRGSPIWNSFHLCVCVLHLHFEGTKGLIRWFKASREVTTKNCPCNLDEKIRSSLFWYTAYSLNPMFARVGR